MAERPLAALILTGAETVAGDVEILNFEQLHHAFTPDRSVVDVTVTRDGRRTHRGRLTEVLTGR
jgi:hypothetical protein